MEDIRDIKDVISVFDWATWLFSLASILFLTLAGYFIYRKLKAKITAKKKIPKVSVIDERPFKEVALDELNAIDPLYYYEKSLFKEYYFLITEIVRKFLSKNYFIDTMDKTSSEIITEVEIRERDYEKVKMLDRYFCMCDLVKFAKYKPSLAQMRENKDDSFRIVKELYRKEVKE